MTIIVRKPWTTQPQIWPGLSTLFGRLRLLYLPNIMRSPLIGQNAFSANTMVPTPGPGGIGDVASSGKFITANYSGLSPSGGSSDNWPHTLVFVYQPKEVAYQWLLSAPTGGARVDNIYLDSAGIVSTDNLFLPGTYISGQMLHLVRTANLFGSTSCVALNGMAGTSTATSTDTRVASPYYVGRKYSTDSEWATGNLYMFAILEGALPQEMAVKLSANCWQLFAPRHIIIPAAATAAATAPTLSDLRAINVSPTSVQWSIDYTFS